MKIFIVCLFVFGVDARSFSPSSRVISGVETTIEEYPSQASLRYSDTHTCGVVLFSATQQLTAARCLDGRLAFGFEIRYGSSDRQTGGTLVGVTDYTMHPEYDASAPGFPNDIAVVDAAVTFDGVSAAPAVLPLPDSTFVNETCTITGWGRSDETNALPVILLKADLTVISNSECIDRMSLVPGAQVAPSNVCVYDVSNNNGACNGDFGGPLFCQQDGQNVLVGISSWLYDTFSVCRTSHPSVYTRMTSYLDWIPPQN